MLPHVLRDPKFPQLLLKVDRELAEKTHREPCQHCGGRLDVANYQRKPRGMPDGLGEEFSVRHSFCCRQEGCRRRCPPPSVRFLGRRVYLAVVVVLVCALEQGITARRSHRLWEALGIDVRTLKRWRKWWQEGLPRTAFYRTARGRLPRPIAPVELPSGLLEQWEGGPCTRLVGALMWLSPLSGNDSNLTGGI